ncbi:hypothetical protein FB480_1174 [Agrobacterium vitis]|nr:hypothetical protein FB480_1174 [Agrobacterium vitis]
MFSNGADGMMTDNRELQELNRSMGRIEGGMTAMAEQMTRMYDQQEQFRQEQSESRARIYQEIDKIRSSAAATQEKVDQLTQQGASHAADIRGFKVWRERLIGMRLLMVFCGSVFMGALAFIWNWISARFGL